MDDRKKIIRELEDKKYSDTEARNELLAGLGETLLQRMGENEDFPEGSESTPGSEVGILAREAAEYRRIQKEIAESADLIRELEADILKLKDLEGRIFTAEEEHARLEKELRDLYMRLGKGLLADSGFVDFTGPFRQQEEFLLARIEEQEKRLEELKVREGGVLSWLGKNAQMAVSKTFLQKNRAALQKVYRSAGEQFLSTGPGRAMDGEAAGDAGEAVELKGRISALAVDLAGLKRERRNLADLFGAEDSPSRRIQGLEKHIIHTRGELPAVYLRFGTMAAEGDNREALSSVIYKDDSVVFEKAELFKTQIAEEELEIEKIKATISIDNEKAEIEKMKKAVAHQQQKIAAANEAILDVEKQIAESQRQIEELNSFLSKHE